jgi:hypothetical protein
MMREPQKVLTMATNHNGRILWEGQSNYDGAPIVIIATGFEEVSANGKTGGMIQTWILRQDVKPNEAFKNGLGKSVCGDCTHAGYNENTCYVLWYQAPLSVWSCYKRGNYQHIGNDWHLFDDVILRIGSAGDPAMCPASVWTEPVLRAKKHTGYSHQWRQDWAQHLKGIVQASCDGFADYLEATAHGWKTYLVTPENVADPAGTVHCAASKERGQKTDCATCALCDGASANVVIHSHGSRGTKLTLQN